MNDFRDRLLAGKPLSDPLLRTKAKAPRAEASRAAEDESFADVAINREAIRQANHRDADRHRLASEHAELSKDGQVQPVTLVNLSGGGAMIEGADDLKLWDRVELKLGGSASLEAIVRWVRGTRFGLEFAHETRIDTGQEQLTTTLLAVIARSFPDVAKAQSDVVAVEPVAEEAAVEGEPHEMTERELRHPLIWSGIVHYDHDSAPVRLRNISSSGALVECATTYPVGAELLLDLGEAGSIFATVNWAHGDQCGLQFRSPYDLAELAKARPQVANSRWQAPDYLRDDTSQQGPWKSQWAQADLSQLHRQLESTRSAIHRR
ncbi:hypothetical protein GGQ97_002201 [Sphingomonas kaistensis]|uniref:PilZ domain-containing protein n=1 Tax=Sphingomonas kaistensis TaxID=298708 RepID=A0A7X5Y7V9_9SPHN|nr:PilZ domain-containing protein [Sphingomonas kaistensis]NJC06408.1 hypothetical protein [Sphingomonas kaistensis]